MVLQGVGDERLHGRNSVQIEALSVRNSATVDGGTTMKRSRRATLTMMLGSGGLLAVDTLGFTRADVDRDVSLEVVSDADAFLGLVETDDGGDIESSDILFGDDETRTAPATFDVINQLTEPIEVTLESDEFTFEPVDEYGRVLTDTEETTIGPGEAVERVVVNLIDPPVNGSTVDGIIEISAEGESTWIEADRELTLDAGIVVGSATMDMFQVGKGRFDHEWQLEDVASEGDPIQSLYFDYQEVKTANAVDFTESENLKLHVIAGDSSDQAIQIDADQPEALEVELKKPLSLGGRTVTFRLEDTGPPAAPGGGSATESGATITLYGEKTETTVAGVWKRRQSRS